MPSRRSSLLMLTGIFIALLVRVLPASAQDAGATPGVTKDEITSRCEICNALALWIAESRLTGATAAYCQKDIEMFLHDPEYEVPPALQSGR